MKETDQTQEKAGMQTPSGEPIPCVELDGEMLRMTANSSSKGNQMKWCSEGQWYKADYMGYEGLAEVLISQLLEMSGVPGTVHYELVRIKYRGRVQPGCRSRNFLREGEELVTVDRLFRQYTGRNLTAELVKIPEVKDRVCYLAENVAEMTGLENFGEYLTRALEIDAFFLNEDRHTNNIAVLVDGKTGEYRLCPYFDNGLALLADTATDFGMEKDLETCLGAIEAKPFCRSFDEQMDAAEELYGCPLKLNFTMKDVEGLLKQFEGIYDGAILRRVEDILRKQRRKYAYLFSK